MVPSSPILSSFDRRVFGVPWGNFRHLFFHSFNIAFNSGSRITFFSPGLMIERHTCSRWVLVMKYTRYTCRIVKRGFIQNNKYIMTFVRNTVLRAVRRLFSARVSCVQVWERRTCRVHGARTRQQYIYYIRDRTLAAGTWYSGPELRSACRLWSE